MKEMNDMLPHTRPNKTGYRGVFATPDGKWTAQFNRVHLGTFATKEEAARAYDYANWQLRHDITQLNFKEVPSVAPKRFLGPVHIKVGRSFRREYPGLTWTVVKRGEIVGRYATEEEASQALSELSDGRL